MIECMNEKAYQHPKVIYCHKMAVGICLCVSCLDHLMITSREMSITFLRGSGTDFVKEGYFFVSKYEVWGSKSLYNPRNIRRVTPEVTMLSSLLPPLTAAKHAEDYKILS